MTSKKYLIPQLSAQSLITFAKETDEGYKFSFDPYDASKEHLVEKTYQDECPMFHQAKAVLKELGVRFSDDSECLYEVFVYIDFSGIFDRKPAGRVLEYQQIAEQMFGSEGITIYGKHGSSRYLAFERSASMSRNDVLSFVREDVYAPLRKRMMLGMEIGRCQLSKLYAYNGLMFTSGRRWKDCASISSESIVIIDNPKSIVRDVHIVTVEDDGSDSPVRKYSRVEKTADIEVLEFDGEGLISDGFASTLSDIVEKTSFQIRLPYIKGVVHRVDIKSLFAELGVRHITDIWGKTHDVRKVELILTKSMFKGFGWMSENGLSWSEYWNRCIEYDHGLYVSGTDKAGVQPVTELNYQFLNTLPMSSDEFRPRDLPLGWTASPKNDPRDWLTKTTETLYYSYVNDLDFRLEYCRNELNSGKYSINADERARLLAAIKNPAFLDEPVFAKDFEAQAESILNKYASGKLLVSGDNRYLSDDLIRLFAYIVKSSVGEGKAYSLLEKEFLSGNEMYAPLPGYDEQKHYTLLRSPHIARNEEALAVPLKNAGKFRKKYLSHLCYVLMVDSRSLIPERMGGADYDGDMVKTVADPLLNACVLRSYESGVPPVLKIPAAEPIIADAGDLKARFETVKSTFSSRVGQISNAALRSGMIAYDENSESAERDHERENTETLAILTGLEIDSAKSGIKPDLSAFLENRKQRKSLFLKYKSITDDGDDRKWYEPTTEKRKKRFIESIDWDEVSSDLERLPYYAYMLKKDTARHTPQPAPDEALFAFASTPDWKQRLDPHTMERTRSMIEAYRAALGRMRHIRHLPSEMKRRGDIERILFSRGQEKDYGANELYALFDRFSAERIRKAREMLSELNWHLLKKEDRELAIYEMGFTGLSEYHELFCDFRAGGYRLLGDLICDIDDMNRSNAISKRVQRKDDGEDLKRMLIGVKPYGDYEQRILQNCRTMIDNRFVGMEKLDPTEVLKCAAALGERSFALEVLPWMIENNAIDVNTPKKKWWKRK